MSSPSSSRPLQPPSWPRPSGYSNGVAVEGRQIFVGGQIGWDARRKFVGTAMADQRRQALANIVTILAEGGVVQVVALVEGQAKIEIEATAVIPSED